MSKNKWTKEKWMMINDQTINGQTIHEQTIHEQTMNEQWTKAKQTTMMAKANSTKIKKSFQHNVDCCVLIHCPPSSFVFLIVVCRPCCHPSSSSSHFCMSWKPQCSTTPAQKPKHLRLHNFTASKLASKISTQSQCDTQQPGVGPYRLGWHPYDHPQHIKYAKHLLYVWCLPDMCMK